MDTKWKKSKVLLGWLAFFLGISLVLESLLFFGAALSSPEGRQRAADSFQGDYQNTQVFRNYLSDKLEQLITLGAGGAVTSTYGTGWYGAHVDHEEMRADKNVLYVVKVSGKEKYVSDDRISSVTQPEQLPEGYNFLLRFDGERARAWKDGQELDLYRDGYYTEDSPWHLPGYQNFTISEEASHVQVTLAVLEHPQIFIKGFYGQYGTWQYNELYWLEEELAGLRAKSLSHLVCLGAGAALLAVYVVLRREKQRFDQFLAHGTGRMWFEGKLALVLILLVCLIPRLVLLDDIWQEVVQMGTSAAATITSTGEVLYDSGITYSDVFSSEAGGSLWAVQAILSDLAQSPGLVLSIFWALYLLIINDWRYNKKPWRHGVLGMLAARELSRPIQKQMSRLAGLTGLTFGALGLMAGYLFLVIVSNEGWPDPLWWYFLVLGPCMSALLLLVWALGRQKNIWTDLGALANHTARLRAGEMDRPLDLPPDHGLYQLADDLNHIQQGLHQAVEERTRSERMKVELVTNVSHDLKTPLTSILSYTELLAQEPLNPPASEYVAILEEKAHRLRAMVQDVFEVSKAATGQLPVKLERLDLGRLLRQTLADMDQAIQNSGLVLRPSIPDEGIPITADSDRLYRVFQNLLSNALAYSLPGSRVYLTLTVEGEQARASVQNTSAAELKPGVDYTARFVRGDESRTDGGSGLGLSIADSFTQACGGVLEITTEADLFTATVIFPLAR